MIELSIGGLLETVLFANLFIISKRVARFNGPECAYVNQKDDDKMMEAY